MRNSPNFRSPLSPARVVGDFFAVSNDFQAGYNQSLSINRDY